MIEQISVASEEQKAFIDEILKVVEAIETVVNENAGASSQSAKISKDLLDEANILRNLVSKFNLN